MVRDLLSSPLVVVLVGAATFAACAQGAHELEGTTTSAGAGASSAQSGQGGQGGLGGSGGGNGGEGMTGPCSSAEECASVSDACNVGTCINGVCEKIAANNGSPCDDSTFCTDTDTCQEGVCTGTLRVCPASDACHVGQCDFVSDTCQEVSGNDGQSCADSDICTVTSQCLSGTCSPGALLDCSFLNTTCTVGVCDPAVGCVTAPVNDGTACDDKLFCTVNDQCQAGVCGGVPNVCVPGANPCMTGQCDEATDTCLTVPGNDGASCDDGNVCTGNETCLNGTCGSGVPANDGMACDDANGCTGGTTCLAGTCTNPGTTITTCTDNDSCCPAGCVADNDCLYWHTGVKQNIPPAALVGWSLCHQDTYGDSTTPVSQVLAQCDKANLLMACRAIGQPNYALVAMAPRVDVLFDCGQQVNCTKQSNGVGWYFSDTWSWGFAPGGLPVNRSSCDYNAGAQQLPGARMCWHTQLDFISNQNVISSGYRCGSQDLNGNTGWERVVYEAD